MGKTYRKLNSQRRGRPNLSQLNEALASAAKLEIPKALVDPWR